ncbi:MAG: hypothetical protein JW838_11165 [Spirochaetes bacterium]|nr:hypothetical protein [Spirochaetota bacterium]
MNIILIIILLVIILILIWALLGGRSDVMGTPGEASRDEQEATFRRRASDKEIEKQYPEEDIHPRRRKTDASEEPLPDEPEAPFKLPYLADEIIPATSRFRIYRRTLLNSEIYAGKGDYATAISLYEGVRSRIQDVDTRFKIDANIEYLKHTKKKREEEARRKEERAKRGETGGAGAGNEIKITLGGSLPGAINIDSLPENINIGLVDAARDLDVDTIVDRVTRRVKGDLDEVKGEMASLKRMPRGSSEEAAPEVMDALDRIGNRLDRIDASGAPEEGTSHTPASSHPAKGVPVESEMADIGRGIRDLGKAISEMTAAQAARDAAGPTLPAAKFDSRGGPPEIPRRKAPEPSPVRAPDLSSKEEITRSTKEGDEGDEFELLSEYGKEHSGEELSDDEIFEKILLDDAKDRAKQEFEILGEKKDRFDEYIVAGGATDSRQQEDESFYRKLLSTTKRKQKELPILKVSYDFTKLPDEIGLSREKNIIEYAFYKYKPMLEKANDFIKKRKVRDAINYYKVVMSQNIPPEFKSMIRRNLDDLNEYLGKYLAGD